MLTFAAVAAASAGAPVDAAPAWEVSASVVLAALGALLWQAYESRKGRAATVKVARMMAATQASAAEIERKVTSNHGHDSIGDKVDELVTQGRERDGRLDAIAGLVDEHGALMGQIVASVGELRAAFADDRRQRERTAAAAEAARAKALLETPLVTPTLVHLDATWDNTSR